MLSMILEILPTLETEVHNDFEDNMEQVAMYKIYEQYTRRIFEKSMRKTLAGRPSNLPQGYDLIQSFYNYSCGLAVQMW